MALNHRHGGYMCATGSSLYTQASNQHHHRHQGWQYIDIHNMNGLKNTSVTPSQYQYTCLRFCPVPVPASVRLPAPVPVPTPAPAPTLSPQTPFLVSHHTSEWAWRNGSQWVGPFPPVCCGEQPSCRGWDLTL